VGEDVVGEVVGLLVEGEYVGAAVVGDKVGDEVVGLRVLVGEKVVGEEVGVEVVEVLEEEAATRNTRLQSGRTESNQSNPKCITFPSPCCHSDTYAEEPAV
jgi:hypothetical protein